MTSIKSNRNAARCLAGSFSCLLVSRHASLAQKQSTHEKESLLNKRTLLVLTVLALAVLLMAACAPATLQPTAAPAAATTAPAAVPATEPAPEPTVAAAAATVAPAAPDTRPTVPAPVEGQRPLADLTPAERVDRFSGPAAPATDPKTIYVATIVTDKGNIVAELYQDTPRGREQLRHPGAERLLRRPDLPPRRARLRDPGRRPGRRRQRRPRLHHPGRDQPPT